MYFWYVQIEKGGLDATTLRTMLYFVAKAKPYSKPGTTVLPSLSPVDCLTPCLLEY
jgi:hypothetical protein